MYSGHQSYVLKSFIAKQVPVPNHGWLSFMEPQYTWASLHRAGASILHNNSRCIPNNYTHIPRDQMNRPADQRT